MIGFRSAPQIPMIIGESVGHRADIQSDPMFTRALQLGQSRLAYATHQQLAREGDPEAMALDRWFDEHPGILDGILRNIEMREAAQQRATDIFTLDNRSPRTGDDTYIPRPRDQFRPTPEDAISPEELYRYRTGPGGEIPLPEPGRGAAPSLTLLDPMQPLIPFRLPTPQRMVGDELRGIGQLMWPGFGAEELPPAAPMHRPNALDTALDVTDVIVDGVGGIGELLWPHHWAKPIVPESGRPDSLLAQIGIGPNPAAAATPSGIIPNPTGSQDMGLPPFRSAQNPAFMGPAPTGSIEQGLPPIRGGLEELIDTPLPPKKASPLEESFAPPAAEPTEKPGLWERFFGPGEDARENLVHFGLSLASGQGVGLGGALRDVALAGLKTMEYDKTKRDRDLELAREERAERRLDQNERRLDAALGFQGEELDIRREQVDLNRLMTQAQVKLAEVQSTPDKLVIADDLYEDALAGGATPAQAAELKQRFLTDNIVKDMSPAEINAEAAKTGYEMFLARLKVDLHLANQPLHEQQKVLEQLTRDAYNTITQGPGAATTPSVAFSVTPEDITR